MKKHLIHLLVALACGGTSVFADVPSTAYLSASHPCSVSVNYKGAVSPYDLTTLAKANDGGSWYVCSNNRTWIDTDTRLTASKPGYLAKWYTYAQQPTSLRETGPSYMTQLLSASELLHVTPAITNMLYARGGTSGAATDFSVKLTPITYSLSYVLAGGTQGESHPTSATYDVPFAVSAPTRSGYVFAGWTANGKTYFEGETADVTLSNLTTTAGANVALTATWKSKQYDLALVCGEGVAKIFYKIGSAEDWSVVTETTKVSGDFGAAWSAYAEPAYGYSLSGLGSSVDDPATGTISTSGGRFEPHPTKVSFAVKVTSDPLEGGTVSGSGNYTYGSETELTARSATGHAFVDWSDGSTENPHKITVLCATNVTARFTAKSYELQLVFGDGVSAIFYRLGGAGDYRETNVSCRISVPYGTTYEAYATTMPGYALSGSGSSIGSPYRGTMGTGGAVFEPKPTLMSYAVTAKASPLDGGTVSGSGNYPYGSEAELTARSATGHAFVDWSDGSTENPHRITVFCATNVTARFTAKSYELQLISSEGVAALFYRLGGAGNYLETNATCTVMVPYGTTYEAHATTMPGYTLSGAGSSIGSPYRGTMGTLGAVFEPKPTKAGYRVTVMSNPSEAGTTKGDGSFAYGAETTLEATAKPGWYFVDWSDGDKNNPHVITVTSTTNVWANFKKHVYDVTFVYRSSTGVEVREEQSVAYGEKANAPTSDKYNCCPGNRFDKWDNNAWGTVTGDLLINAIYVPNTYTVKYNGNGATSGTVNDQTLTYDVEQALALNRYIRTGYRFTGWCTHPTDQTGDHYSDEQRVKNIVKATDGTMLAQGATLTLYAQWEPIQYTIRFAANGGSGDMPDMTVKYDEAVALTKNAFSHVQDFRGWTGSDGRSYADGETVTRLTATDDAIVIMKAQWTDTGTIRFHRNVDGADETYKQSVEKDVEVALLPNTFTRTGYTFECWTNSVGNDYQDLALVTNLATPGDTTELYAKWTPITYTVQFEANGGSGKMEPQTLTYDVGTVIGKGFGEPAAGWKFVGWGTNTTEVLIAEKDEVKNLSSIDGDHVRLYAVWKFETSGWAIALGCSNLVFTAAPDNAWNSNAVEYVKRDASSSGDATLKANLPCSGALTFDWYAEEGDSELEIEIDGESYAKYEPQLACTWEEKTVHISGVCSFTFLHKTQSVGRYGCRIRRVKWEPKVAPQGTKEVSFVIDDQRGSRISGGATNQTVAVGGAALAPTVRGIPGWTFTGWSDYGFTNVTADLKVTAQYERTTYQLVYEKTNGKVNLNPTQFVSTDAIKEFAKLKDDAGNVAAGFLGWSPSGLIQGTTSNLVVTAMWQSTEVTTNTVTYVSGTDGGTTNKVDVLDGKNAKWPEVASEDGWAFVGWDKSTDDVTGNVVVRARYEAIAYPVVYKNTKGVDHSNPLSYDITSEFELSSPLNRDTRLDFLGWTPTNRLEKGKTGEQVFTANWAYLVACECGAHVHAGADPLDIYVAEGGNTNAPNVTVDAGYSLDGWYGADGKKVESPFTNVTEAVTYTAFATPIAYTITYANLEGATHANPSTFTVEDAVTFTEPSAREGYVFTGWVPAGIARGTASNVTARATWRQTFPVVIDGKVGTYECGSTVVATTAASVTNGKTNIVCTGWVGTGDVPEHGTSNSVSFVVTQASTLAWEYATNYWVAVGVSGEGTVEVRDGEGAVATNPGWFAAGTTNLTATAKPADGWLFARWESGVVDTVDAESLRVREEVDTPYSDAVRTPRLQSDAVRTPRLQADAVGTSRLLEVTAPVELTAVFTQKACRVTFDLGAHLQRTGGGETTQFVSRGGNAVAPTVRADDGYEFSGWVGSFSNVVEDVTVDGRVVKQTFPVVIDGKDMTCEYGSNVVATTAASVTNGMTNVVCVGWVGTGDVPEHGTSNSVSFVVTQASTLAWEYATNYWVAVSVSGEGTVEVRDGEGAVATNPGWFAAGTNLTATATAEEGWAFARWESGVVDTVDAESLRVREEVDNPYSDAVRTPRLQSDAVGTPRLQADAVRTPRLQDAGASFAFEVTAPVELTAVFTQKTYSVVFELDEHLARVGGGELQQTVAHGEAAELPTVEGIGYHALEGWYDADGRPVDAASLRVITSSATYYARSVEAEPYIAAEVAAEYETKVAIDPIVLRCVHEEDATLKVTGLPTGLKFTTKEVVDSRTKKVTAPANSIYGTPSRSGLFTAAVTASVTEKVGSRKVTTVVATTNLAFVVRADGETVVRTEIALAEEADPLRSDEDVASPLPGKTTGQGVYAVGRKVTLKATANKGYVFSGWYSGEALVSRLASLALVVPEDDTVYEARFITAAADAASIAASVAGLPLIAGGIAGTAATNVSVGVYFEWPVAYSADSSATVAVSGLPTGLKFTAKPITQTVTVGGVRTVVTNVPANTIYGTPTAASKVDRSGAVVPSQVKVTVTTAGRAKATGVLALTVEALPEALVGTYVGGSTNDPIGSASVTLAKTGKVSGKWISEGKTWSLTAANLDGIVDDVATATVTFKSGKLTETHPMTFAVASAVASVVSVPSVADDLADTDATERVPPLFIAAYVPWKTDPVLKALAIELKGEKFTVASDDGVTLTGTVGASGVVSVKGSFDLGAKAPYTATVSATLEPVDEDLERFELFVYYPPNVSKKFDGYAARLRLAWDGETLK